MKKCHWIQNRKRNSRKSISLLCSTLVLPLYSKMVRTHLKENKNRAHCNSSLTVVVFDSFSEIISQKDKVAKASLILSDFEKSRIMTLGLNSLKPKY